MSLKLINTHVLVINNIVQLTNKIQGVLQPFMTILMNSEKKKKKENQEYIENVKNIVQSITNNTLKNYQNYQNNQYVLDVW